MKKTIAPFRAKTVAMLACLSMLLAACTPKDQSTETSLLGEAETDIFNETGYPIVKEPITLKTVYPKQASHGNLDQMPTLQLLQEVSGIKLDIEQIPGPGYDTKISLMFAGGELPDFIPSWGPNNLINYIELLRPLGRYIDSYMPNLRNIFAQRPDYRKGLQLSNGEIYQLLMVAENVNIQTPTNLFINNKWLNALGLAIPETTDEFYEVLKAFKEGDPNGNGKADEIPIASGGLGEFSFTGSFLFPLQPYALNYLKVSPEGRIEFVLFTEAEGFQQFAEWWQKLYQERLVDIESYTQAGSVLSSKVKEGVIGVFGAWFDENMAGTEGVQDYTLLKPLRGPDGLEQWPRMRLEAGSTFMLPKSNAYPASTMRLMDMGYEPDYAWQIVQGPWDIVLERTGQGKVRAISAPEGLSDDEWRYQNTVGYAWPYALLLDEYANWIGPQTERRKTERHYVLEPFLPPAEAYVPRLNFTMEEQTELSVLSTDITDFIKQQYVGWITQGDDIRKGWPDFVEKLNAIGAERYVEIYQAAYERFMNQ